jgi:Tfp pilus assembly protein PilF
MKPEPATKATFITFYSFKGGVGRSMALINTAGILAGRRGFRVLVLDLDLEAPGLTYLDPESPDVAPAEVQRELPLQAGFVDLMTDALAHGEAADLFKLPDAELEAKYTRAIKLPDPLREFPDGSLRIMPSGRCDHDYSQRLDALNLNALYREGLGEPLIRAFKKRFAESGRYDYVLVDSRTGISEGAGICTRDLADHVMVLSGLNRQNVEGTSEFLREFRAATDGKRSIQVILSPMPNGEDTLLDRRREVAERRFQAAWGDRVDLSLEIPYHPQLALTEEPHIFRRRRGYLVEAYRRIEASMLIGLGHDAQTFRQRVIQSLEGKRYPDALRELHHMIRLDNGRAILFWLVDLLLNEGRPNRSAELEPTREPVSLERLLAEDAGRSVADFVVEHIELGESDWLPKRLIHALTQRSPGLAEKLVQRILEAVGANSSALGDYAAHFEQQGEFDRAETFYKRAVDADPAPAGILASYAGFLEKRERFEDAEVFYRRAVETDPKHAGNLGSYASFLRRRGRSEDAETFYRRSVEADPKHVGNLGNYAVFLERQGRIEDSEVFYRRALEEDPKRPSNLGNYGQFLAGSGHLQDGEEKLLQASRDLEDVGMGDAAEICFSLWLIARMRQHDGVEWERQFKSFIERGFKRHPWSFERMLKQAEKLLSPDEFEYAKALAAAFLDEKKVADLAKFPRWQELKPLAPPAASLAEATA